MFADIYFWCLFLTELFLSSFTDLRSTACCSSRCPKLFHTKPQNTGHHPPDVGQAFGAKWHSDWIPAQVLFMWVEVLLVHLDHLASSPRQKVLTANTQEGQNTKLGQCSSPVMILIGTVCSPVVAVNGTRAGRPKLETFYPNVTEFNLRLPNRSTRYKLELAAINRVGSGEALVEELPHFTNEGLCSF